MQQNAKAVMVIGMPRSGSSIIADMLTILGLDSGTNRPQDDFVNNDLTLVHEILMRDLGCNWGMIGALPPDWQTSEAAEKANSSIRSILKRHFSKSNTWVINDPRMCRFLPLWLTVLKEMHITPALVVTVRHPLENARSLAAHDGFDPRNAFLLWLSTHRDIFSISGSISHLLTTFDQVLADPVSVLQYISTALDLEYPKPLHENYTDILTSIHPEMKHHHSSSMDEPSDFVYNHYIDLYEQIRRVCINQVPHLSIAHDSNEKPVINAGKDLPAILRQGFLSTTDNSKEDRASAPLFHDMRSIIGDFERRAHAMELERKRLLIASSASPGTILYAQAYFPQTEEPVFRDTLSKKVLLAPAEWQEIVFLLPDPIAAAQKGIKFAPLNIRGMVHIASIHFTNPATHEPVLKLDSREAAKAINNLHGAFSLPESDTLSLFVFDNNPNFMIGPMPDLPDCPLEIRIWIKPETHQKLMKSLLDNSRAALTQSNAALVRIAKEKENVEASRKKLSEQLVEAQSEITSLSGQLSSANTEISSLSGQLSSANTEISSLSGQLSSANTEISSLSGQLSSANTEISSLSGQLSSVKEKNRSFSQLFSKAKAQNSALTQLLTKVQARNRALDEQLNQALSQVKELSEILKRTEIEKTELSKIKTNLQNQLADQTRVSADTLNNNTESQHQIEALKRSLTQQKDLTRQYFTELSQTESELASLKTRLNDVKTSAPQAQTIPAETSWQRPNPAQGDRLISKLESDFNALTDSARWKVGNSIIRGIEILLLRKKPRLAIDHMKDIFDEYKTSQYSSQWQSSDKLQTWMWKLKSDFDELLDSKRWQVGNRIVRTAEICLFRKKKPMAVDHMQAIFEQFFDSSFYRN